MPRASEPEQEPVTFDLPDGAQLTTYIDPSTRKHHVICDRCGMDITLTITADAMLLTRHRDSNNCRKRAKYSRNSSLAPERLQTPASAASLANLLSESVSARSFRAGRPSTPPPTSTPSSLPCSGLEIEWKVGSIWSTYPYYAHELRDMDWEPIGFLKDKNKIIIRSVRCKKFVATLDGAHVCVECWRIPQSQKFKDIIERAYLAPDHTPHDLLTEQQVRAMLAKIVKRFRSLRIDLYNARRKLRRLSGRLDDYDRMIMLIASNDIVGIRRIIGSALYQGASPRAICDLLNRAINGLYAPRKGFTERDLDVAFLVKALGGTRLLYALQKSHRLASESTVRRHKKIPRLLASVHIPTKEEADHNILAFCDPEIIPPPSFKSATLPGNVLMVDGVALETRCRYCPHRNAIIGLCREHAHRVSTEVTDLQSVESVRTALFDASTEEKVCFGSDATVVAIGSYARDDYYAPVPLIVSPSDKTETGEGLASWLLVFMAAWAAHIWGTILRGPIWALASDGDSTFRLAKFLICFAEEIGAETALGRKLVRLFGLNRWWSKDGVIATCDPKHIFKRFATLLRNFNGIMINDVNINPVDILNNLAELPHLTIEKAKQLLDPADKQNVPKAVMLLQELMHIQDLPNPLVPSAIHKRSIINFVAEFLGYFVLPFIDIDMSLSAQVTSLVTYAFLAAALQIAHGTSCLTGALYCDSQSVVKNIIITIARLQLIDPDLKFYIILEGTDRLELVFSDVRTQDHGRNFDIEQLSEKLGVGALVNAAFQRNPELDRGHRRLKLKDVMGIDHVNPSSWKGNARVGDVDLEVQWRLGYENACAILRRYFGDSLQCNFEEIFHSSGFDLLRPDGSYVGVRFEANDDRSEVENPPDLRGDILNLEEVIISRQSPDMSLDIPSDYDSETSEVAVHITEPQYCDRFSIQDNSSNFVDSLVTGTSLDDFMLETCGGIEADSVEPSAPVSKVIEEGGKKYSKYTLVASLSSNRTKKVTMRPLRAFGVAVEDLRSQKSKLGVINETVDGDVVKSGDLVACLVKSKSFICLVVIEVQGFQFGGEKIMHTTVLIDDLEAESKKIFVVGQVLDLETQKENPNLWQWTRKYLQVDSSAKNGRITRRNLVIEVPGFLVYPLAADIKDRVSDSTPLNPLEPPLTWQFTRTQLLDMVKIIWDSLEPDGDTILATLESLPSIINPGAVPYRNYDGKLSFYVENLPMHLVPKKKLAARDEVTCFLCGAKLQLSKMRNHVGGHILRNLRSVEDQNLTENVGEDACGFCGRNGCRTQFLHNKKGGFSITSTCQYHYSNMNYKKARESTKTMPCSNVPIHCTLCPVTASGQPRTIWKYHAMYHIVTEHGTDNGFPHIPGELMVNMFISRAEEKLLGIPDDSTSQWRDENEVPSSDFVYELGAGTEESSKRPRGESVSSIVTLSTPKSKKIRGR
ncbi:hypothetical protein VKT23_002721 [Stygiomarasmius scandens]|uniref:C2H2-type domain-containing protein n=1 Tax=Marasmiellus scandens TaxID=2682957 RepID=A0ABR1K3Y2_9AGAR